MDTSWSNFVVFRFSVVLVLNVGGVCHTARPIAGSLGMFCLTGFESLLITKSLQGYEGEGIKEGSYLVWKPL
jgi:hypothetical protein